MKGFDEIIKEKLTSLEGPFDASAWAFIEAGLNKPATAVPSSGFSTAVAGGIAATAALGLLFTSLPDLGNNRQTAPAPVHQELVIPGDTQVETSVTTDALTATEHTPQEVHAIDFISHQWVVEDEKPAAGDVKNIDGREQVAPVEVNTPSHASAGTHDKGGNEATKPAGNLDFSATGIQCPGSEIVFKAMTDNKNAEVKWLFDGVHIAEGQTVRFSFETAGEHEAIMLYRVPGEKPLKLRKPFRVYDVPSPDLSYSTEYNEGCFNQEVTLKAVPGSNTYQWELDGKSIGSGTSLKTMLAPGTHSARLTAVNAEGCTTRETAVIAVDAGLQIFAPNTFTPDADGTNDIWFPVGLEEVASFSLQIVSFQDKSLVFETREIEPWNGSIRGTNERPRKGEKFIWSLLATDQCGQQKQYTGMISIL